MRVCRISSALPSRVQPLRRDLDAPLAEGCEVPAEVLNKIQHTIRESLLVTASVAIRGIVRLWRGVRERVNHRRRLIW